MTDPDDPGMPPPDAHLRAALLHAPDRDLQPPPLLSARILAEARRAVAPPPWPQRLWAWLARPVPAGAFSSLLLAGFIGLMWREGPPPEAIRPEAMAQAPETSVPQGKRTPQVSQTPQTPSAPPVATADRQAASREQAARAREQMAFRPPAVTPKAEPASRESQDAFLRRSRPEDDIVAPPPPPVPSPSAEQAEPAELTPQTPPVTAAPGQRAAAPEAAAAPPTTAGSRAESPSMPAPLARDPRPTAAAPRFLRGNADASGAPSVQPDPLAASLAAWRAAGPDRAASRRWWEDLRAQTQGRWRRSEPVDGADGILVPGPDGEPLGTLRWEPTAVHWQPTGEARGWRAELSAADVERLRGAMTR